jgi:hypothetical protein
LEENSRGLSDEMFFVELDFESSVDFVGRRLRGELLAPEGNHFLDSKETHRKMAHVSDSVILPNLLEKIETNINFFFKIYFRNTRLFLENSFYSNSD